MNLCNVFLERYLNGHWIVGNVFTNRNLGFFYHVLLSCWKQTTLQKHLRQSGKCNYFPWNESNLRQIYGMKCCFVIHVSLESSHVSRPLFIRFLDSAVLDFHTFIVWQNLWTSHLMRAREEEEGCSASLLTWILTKGGNENATSHLAAGLSFPFFLATRRVWTFPHFRSPCLQSKDYELSLQEMSRGKKENTSTP